jgi:RNA polymerase sigma-70 factor (ECF subfamily)
VDADPSPGSAGVADDRRRRYERVFRLAYEPLQRYVRRRAEAHDVDDIVTDALTVMWRRLDDVPVGAELAWSYGVARRCLANHRRSTTRRARLDDKLMAAAPRPPGGGWDPVDDPELDLALADLSADDRELVRLWAWEQLEPREIAVVLDITANAASIRLHRAKARLAERLAARKDDASSGHEPDGHRPRREDDRR